MSKQECSTNFKIIVEVLNSILRLPHFNSLVKRCLSSVVECDYCKILNIMSNVLLLVEKGIWCSGMILTSGARGLELNSRNGKLYKC